jgi:H+-translocating NAD(P) transhydrogenase subunit beta
MGVQAPAARALRLIFGPLKGIVSGLPFAGMPIFRAFEAGTVMVVKRSMSPGFAGIDNELYYIERTLILFGDAKSLPGALSRNSTPWAWGQAPVKPQGSTAICPLSIL